MDFSEKTTRLVSLYRTWASVPSVDWGKIIKSASGEISIQANFSAYHIGQQDKTSFRKCFLMKQEDKFRFSSVGFPVDSSHEALFSVSPSHKLSCMLRKSTQQFLEVWTLNSLWKSWDLAALNVHGDVNDDGQFGSLQWSSDETKLAYVAEKKKPKTVSFFKQKIDENNDDIQEKGIGQYREEWGEQLVGRCHPITCVLDINTTEITEIDLGDKSCGQVIWGPEDKSLICVGWNEEPRKLGLIFCTNRKSALYRVDLENENEISTLYANEGWSCASPRLSPDSKTLVFLESPDHGPHRAGTRLCKMDLSTRDVSVVVDVIEKAYGEDFPGLYCQKLNSNCFSTDGQNVFVTSSWKSKMEILCININSGSVNKIPTDLDVGSTKLLDVVDNQVLACCCAPNMKPHLVFSDLNDYLDMQNTPVWYRVEDADPNVPDIHWKIINFQPKQCDDEASNFQSILITPTLVPEKKLPLVVIPHGGPHSVTEAGYFLFPTLFVKMDFAVLLVNYRGSLGFGDKVLRSLLGSVGSTDVSDVQQSVDYVLAEDWVDSSNTILFGGSHGGFLSTHLIGQHPDVYQVCICRNPVVDISGKLEGTDIPDWGFAESGQQDEFNFTTLPSPKYRKLMWDHSPYQYISKVKTPVLMLIGRNDRRVPPTQGINYYHTLKAMGKPCQIYVYDDNHSLSSSKVESDVFVRTGLWIFQHLRI